MSVPEAVIQAIRDADRILIATHSPMDGDGMGCGLALKRCLEKQGKHVDFVTEGNIPRAYVFLAGYDAIRQIGDGDPLPACDLVIGLDAGEEGRLGRAASERGDTPLVNIDHHISNTRFGEVAWVDPTCAATGEQVHDLLVAMEADIDGDAALCLLVSLVTDTGRFCYSNTTERTLRTAASLVAFGADPDRLQRRLFASIPMAMLRLQARSIDHLALHADGAVCVLVVDHDFGADLGADEEHLKDLVDLVISVQSARVAALIRGLGDGTCKVSLRSKSDEADVAAFAGTHGGGGHVRAAGFSSPDSPEATLERILPGLTALSVGSSG